MRILSGIQSSGRPHIGNYLGAMRQHIALQKTDDSFYFIADLHSLTTVRDPQKLQDSIVTLALDYLALGLNPEKGAFFRQSDVSAHSELMWILSCITPLGLMERAHAFKDAKDKGKKEITAGLFTYPILMAADILLYQPDKVPVGQDQKQHVEIARDIATTFNHHFGETFKIPEPDIKKEVAVVPGTDGQKMSKSYGNTIDIFGDEASLKKQVMSIVTDSKGVDEPKDAKDSVILKLYEQFASPTDTKTLREKFERGGLGYGDAKKMLLECLLEYFKEQRKKRIELEKDLGYVWEVLKLGAEKAQKVAGETMEKVRKNTGLGKKAL